MLVYVCIYSRIDSMVNEKLSLIEQRRKAGAEARLQKERILKMMDLMRTKSTAKPLSALNNSGSQLLSIKGSPEASSKHPSRSGARSGSANPVSLPPVTGPSRQASGANLA